MSAFEQISQLHVRKLACKQKNKVFTHLVKLNNVWMPDFFQYFNLSRNSVNVFTVLDPRFLEYFDSHAFLGQDVLGHLNFSKGALAQRFTDYIVAKLSPSRMRVDLFLLLSLLISRRSVLALACLFPSRLAPSRSYDWLVLFGCCGRFGAHSLLSSVPALLLGTCCTARVCSMFWSDLNLASARASSVLLLVAIRCRGHTGPSILLIVLALRLKTLSLRLQLLFLGHFALKVLLRQIWLYIAAVLRDRWRFLHLLQHLLLLLQVTVIRCLGNCLHFLAKMIILL